MLRHGIVTVPALALLMALAAPAAAALRRTYVPVNAAGGPHFTPRVLLAAGHRIIYMNRDGGTFTPGWNDSPSNTSSIPEQVSTIPPWTVSDSGWLQVMSCMRAVWAPFDVDVTDVDPGNVDHIESVVAGLAADLSLPENYGGVSPYDCGVIERSIVFTFAEAYGDDYRAICETAAQEVAHSFGLDHELLCDDPMTYLTDCGNKSFQDVAADCGEYEARECYCGGSTQNSMQMLLAATGPGSEEPPETTIVRPRADAVVEPGFLVVADISAVSGGVVATLLIDGTATATLTSPPWVFATSTNLADGLHVVQVRASSAAGAGTDAVTVMVGGGPDPGALGDPCVGSAECASGLCAVGGGDGWCTLSCSASAPCPAGFACADGDVCWPATEPSGGCATAGANSFPALLLVGVVFLCVAGRRRLLGRDRESRRVI